MQTLAEPTAASHSQRLRHWEKTGDLMDQCIDLMLNLRQSGHPGGSRSKIPMLVAATLGAGMRWDVRNPSKPFADRFVLIAGHCCPAVYALLAVYNEALRIRHEQTGDARYTIHGGRERTLLWEDLLWLRHNGQLPGHAEMEGKTLIFKFNTGPTGHGAPPALGEAFALKHAGVGEVKVFAVEGEGGHTAGAHHEVKNSAYGLGCDNLVYLLDWNDHGIDSFANSEVVHGGPREWFENYGWRVDGTEQGEDYGEIARVMHAIAHAPDTGGRPGMAWFKTRKGRGYYKFDAASHGAAHKRNSDLFWRGRQDFRDKYGVELEGWGDTTDTGEDACREQTRGWFEQVFAVLRDDQELVEYLTDTLVELGDSVPERPEGFRLGSGRNLHEDRDWLDPEKLPAELFVEPGASAPNRAGFSKFGAWMNHLAKKEMGRPLTLALSADLADSTSISGFAKASGDFDGFGWYERDKNPGGSLLPQQITEFTNAGMCAGIATVNMSSTPENEFLGYWATCSTYGSFSYLKYGLMRLFSQLAQDCELKVGKIIWVVGHSGPETAEDSRTHFGIFAPGVTQLFPSGHVVNLTPWEHNEVAPALAAALRTDKPLIALHLTRPNVTIPDRAALGMDSHLCAAKGAYIIRDHDPARPKEGTVIVQGTSTTDSIMELLPRFSEPDAPNVKLVAAISWDLFQLAEPEWRERVLPHGDWLDSTVVTNGARRLMHDWLPHKVAECYAMSSDWDDRWRTGGNVAEVKREARIDPDSLWDGIRRFATDRDKRLAALAHPGDA